MLCALKKRELESIKQERNEEQQNNSRGLQYPTFNNG
jgi:hypothetical protein